MGLGVKMMTGVLKLLALQPLKVQYFWSGLFYRIMKNIFRYRRDVTMINLARSFPDKKYGELSEIASRSYSHLADLITESIWFAGSGNLKRLHDSHIFEISNPDLLNEFFENTKSVVILNSHRGNWEFTGGMFQYFYGIDPVFGEKDLSVVYKKMKSPFWDKIFAANRCSPVQDKSADCYLESSGIMRYVITNKLKRKIYVFPTDQYPYSNSAPHKVNDFMHQPTSSMTGGAAIARKFGFSVLYMSTDIVSRGHYSVTFKEICRDASSMTVEEVMDRYYKMLEEDIDRQPWNYLWTHKRWK